MDFLTTKVAGSGGSGLAAAIGSRVHKEKSGGFLLNYLGSGVDFGLIVVRVRILRNPGPDEELRILRNP